MSYYTKNVVSDRFDTSFSTSGTANLIENFNLQNNTQSNALLKVVYRYIEDFSRRRDINYIYSGLGVTKKSGTDNTVTIGTGEAVIAGRWFNLTTAQDYDITDDDGTYYLYIKVVAETTGYPLVTESDTRDPVNEKFVFAHGTTYDDDDNRQMVLAKIVKESGAITTVTIIPHNRELMTNYLVPRNGNTIYFYGGDYANRTEVFNYNYTTVTFNKEVDFIDDIYPQGNIVVSDGGTGHVSLSNTELKYLDNLNQYLTTTSDVTFKTITTTSTITLGDNLNLNNHDLTVDGTHTITNSSLEYLVGLDQSLKTTDDVIFNNLSLTDNLNLGDNDLVFNDGSTTLTLAHDLELKNLDGLDQSLKTTDDVTFKTITTTSTITLGDNLNLNNHNLVLDGSHIITNSSLEYLVGLNQSLKTTDNVTFNKLTLNSDLDLEGNNLIVDSGGDITLSATELHYIDGLNQYLTTTSNVTFNQVSANLIGNVTGNASTASKWATGRTFSLSGDVTGSVSSVDGSNDVTINTTVANDSHTHSISTLTDIDQVLKTTSDVTFNSVTANLNGNINGHWSSSRYITIPLYTYTRLDSNWAWVNTDQYINKHDADTTYVHNAYIYLPVRIPMQSIKVRIGIHSQELLGNTATVYASASLQSSTDGGTWTDEAQMSYATNSSSEVKRVLSINTNSITLDTSKQYRLRIGGKTLDTDYEVFLKVYSVYIEYV